MTKFLEPDGAELEGNGQKQEPLGVEPCGQHACPVIVHPKSRHLHVARSLARLHRATATTKASEKRRRSEAPGTAAEPTARLLGWPCAPNLSLHRPSFLEIDVRDFKRLEFSHVDGLD